MTNKKAGGVASGAAMLGAAIAGFVVSGGDVEEATERCTDAIVRELGVELDELQRDMVERRCEGIVRVLKNELEGGN